MMEEESNQPSLELFTEPPQVEEKKKKKKRKSPGGNFPCPYCDYVGKSVGALNFHKMHHHLEEYNKERIREGKKPIGAPGTETNKKAVKSLNVSKSFSLEPNTLALVQMMIKSGEAKDLNDLINKSIHLKAYGRGINPNGGQNTMDSTNPDAVIKKMMDAKMAKKVMNAFDDNDGSDFNMNAIMKMMHEQLKMKMLMKALGDDQGSSQIELFKMMMAMQNQNKNPLQDPVYMQMQAQNQAIKQQMDEMRRKMEDAKQQQTLEAIKQMSQSKPVFQDFLATQERMRGQTQKEIEALKNQLQQREIENLRMEQQKHYEDMMGMVKEATEKNFGSFGEAFKKKMENKILDRLDVGQLIEEKKEGNMDKVVQTISTIAEGVGPVITSMLENRQARQQQAPPPPPQQFISPEQAQQMEMQRQQMMAQQQGQPPQAHPQQPPMMMGDGQVPGMQNPMPQPQENNDEDNPFPPGYEWLNDPLPPEDDY